LPDAGDAFEIARAIERCPAGALKYSFTRDYLPAESGDDTRVVALADGPLWLRGSITLVTEEGETHETRLALCRCGSSARPPFCDASGPCTGWRTPPPAKQAPASAGGAQGG
ncbi:MAG: CDGSH iron-sulfur domain-containing protein, partial [Bifidobacteriaceae bacterium]|nr:CDGSH iron-sulfur domain-containing protein [Bifidobacteriaceae bacterium]